MILLIVILNKDDPLEVRCCEKKLEPLEEDSDHSNITFSAGSVNIEQVVKLLFFISNQEETYVRKQWLRAIKCIG